MWFPFFIELMGSEIQKFQGCSFASRLYTLMEFRTMMTEFRTAMTGILNWEN